MNGQARVFGPASDGTYDVVIEGGRRRSGVLSDTTVALLRTAVPPIGSLDTDYRDTESKWQEMPPGLVAAFKARRTKA